MQEEVISIERALERLVTTKGGDERVARLPGTPRPLLEKTEAAKALSQLPVQRCIRPLERVIFGDCDAESKQAACYALTLMLDCRAVGVLIRVILAPDLDGLVRAQASEGVGSGLEGESSRDALFRRGRQVLEGALKDRDPRVRFWACYGLGAMRSVKSRNKIRKLLSDHSPGWDGKPVAEEARWALDRLAGVA